MRKVNVAKGLEMLYIHGMAKVVIIQGGLDGGKTTYMRKLMDELVDVDGIVTLKDSAKRTYYFHEVRTRLSYMGLSADMILSDERFGRYFISRKAFKRASDYIFNVDSRNVLLDEVGRMECMGDGFAEALRELLKRDITLYIAVRDRFVPMVIESFGIENAEIMTV